MNSVTTSGTTVTNTTNSQNELTGMGNTTLTYDNNGNTLTDDQGHTLIYDAWNRLVTVENSGGTMVEAYTYDGLGHRITEKPTGAPDDFGSLIETSPDRGSTFFATAHARLAAEFLTSCLFFFSRRSAGEAVGLGGKRRQGDLERLRFSGGIN